ncbi:hypothetical protein BC828DRAFT_388995 [Blastocladiella britannica]|nr:hypothetical protein BC828DRAFT_388995 [Blastocladiella britannica]
MSILTIVLRDIASMEFNRHLTAIEEMGNNFCCKIYGILSHIGFHTMYEGLNEDDRRLLYGIERYLDFKIGVIWDEIAFELQSEGIRPVSPDQQVLDAVRAAVEAKTAQVQRLQRDSTREFTERKSAKEGEFFSIFMHSHHLIKEPATMAPRAAPAKSSSSPIEGQSMTDRGGDIAPPQQGTKAKRRVSLGFLDVIAPEKEAHQTVASGRYKGLAHASVVRMAVPDDEK